MSWFRNQPVFGRIILRCVSFIEMENIKSTLGPFVIMKWELQNEKVLSLEAPAPLDEACL